MFNKQKNSSNRYDTLPNQNKNKSHMKMDDWEITASFWVSDYFQGRVVSFRDGGHGSRG